MDLFGASMDTLQKSLDVRMAAQRVAAANIANVDTPGYQAQRIDFERSMENAIEGLSDPVVVEQSTAPAVGLDGNNVNMEQELSQLSQNKLMYSVTAQIMSAKFRQLHTALDAERG